jgi:hypothetical protein
LRRERRQSPRSEADADHIKVKTEMLQLRLMEKKRELVRRADVDALIDRQNSPSGKSKPPIGFVNVQPRHKKYSA